MPRAFTQDPQAVLDYQFDWAGERPWLVAGDTISDATVTVTAGLTIEETVIAATTVTVWLKGGTVGASYNVTCHIVTAGGREDERTATVTIMDR
jgi:hypothetical protein